MTIHSSCKLTADFCVIIYIFIKCVGIVWGTGTFWELLGFIYFTSFDWVTGTDSSKTRVEWRGCFPRARRESPRLREVQASRMPRGGSGMLPLELTTVASEIDDIKSSRVEFSTSRVIGFRLRMKSSCAS